MHVHILNIESMKPIKIFFGESWGATPPPPNWRHCGHGLEHGRGEMLHTLAYLPKRMNAMESRIHITNDASYRPCNSEIIQHYGWPAPPQPDHSTCSSSGHSNAASSPAATDVKDAWYQTNRQLGKPTNQSSLWPSGSLPLGTEQVVSSIPGSVGYISHVHWAYDYLGPFGVLWVHMAWHKNCVKKTWRIIFPFESRFFYLLKMYPCGTLDSQGLSIADHCLRKPSQNKWFATTNKDFTSNVKNIHRFAQILHHKEVWTEFPLKSAHKLTR